MYESVTIYIDVCCIAAQERQRVGVLVLHRLRNVDYYDMTTVVAAGKKEGKGGQDISWQSGSR
jgi:hypothetical protein